MRFIFFPAPSRLLCHVESTGTTVGLFIVLEWMLLDRSVCDSYLFQRGIVHMM
jgi:hypothetical protein